MSPASATNNLVSRDEEVLVEARRRYYEGVKREKRNAEKLQFGQYIGEKISLDLTKKEKSGYATYSVLKHRDQFSWAILLDNSNFDWTSYLIHTVPTFYIADLIKIHPL